ncbi:MAG TPA: ABC-type transport auxiliary lipoprotein family protein [Burkholderiales bacterium]
MERASAGIFALALVLAGGACSFAPAPGPLIASYDFGPPPEARQVAGLRQALLVHDVGAPAWLDSPFIYYRLGYQDATRPQAYAGSRWVTSPAELFTNRLRGRLVASGGGIIQPGDDARAKYALRVDLDEFVQVFDAPGKSRAVVRFRASVMGNRSLIVQRSFSVERPASTPDAEGGVRALIGASDEAVEQLVGWTAQHLKD